ncbi:uncharacterized protein N7518_007745, partial [Penicillium psychrosexuale]|uniref:uncharacterized protein n=1 Tax=Penicillium psychrosexuale TaxID=1002107 RepID=UPI0025457E9F
LLSLYSMQNSQLSRLISFVILGRCEGEGVVVPACLIVTLTAPLSCQIVTLNTIALSPPIPLLLVIYNDERTINLLKSEDIAYKTKLRYMDIYRY